MSEKKFFENYLNSRSTIDFKIKKVSKTDDSITLTIKNKRDNNMPVSLFTMRSDSVVSKTWFNTKNSCKSTSSEWWCAGWCCQWCIHTYCC